MLECINCIYLYSLYYNIDVSNNDNDNDKIKQVYVQAHYENKLSK